MRKGIEVLRLLIVPAEVRRPEQGESFKALIRVGVAKTARDGVDHFQGETAEALCGINPRIAELSRELLDLVAQELAEENDGQLVYVVDGPNVKTDFTTFDYAARRREPSRPRAELRVAPPSVARPSESSLDRIERDDQGIPRLRPRAEPEAAAPASQLGEGPGAFAPPLETASRSPAGFTRGEDFSSQSGEPAGSDNPANPVEAPGVDSEALETDRAPE